MARLGHVAVSVGAVLMLTAVSAGPAASAPTPAPPRSTPTSSAPASSAASSATAPTTSAPTSGSATPTATPTGSVSSGATPLTSVPPAPSPAPSPTAPPVVHTVSVTLGAMTPRVPDPFDTAQKVTFRLFISNNSDTTYSDLMVHLERTEGSIARTDLLEQALQTPPSMPIDNIGPFDVKKVLPPHGSLDVTYTTTQGDMCLCFNGAYPYAIVVTATSPATQGFVEVGRTEIVVPSHVDHPVPARMAWVWPLLEEPHRLLSDTVFTDNALALDVAEGGRLNRALKVAQLLAGKVRLTLVIDPDLVESLAVMAAGYQVSVAGGPNAQPQTGTGGILAAQWLQTLKSVAPYHDIVLTPYADPDVDAVTRAGLPWSTALDSVVAARIAQFIPIQQPRFYWPAGSELTSAGLDAVVQQGFTSVLLDSTALPYPPPVDQSSFRPDSVAPLPSPAGKAVALVTDDALQATFARTLKLGAISAADQEELLSRVAVRVAENANESQLFVVTPDRYVSADPNSTAATIASFSHTGWSENVSLAQALSTAVPTDRGPLQVSPTIQNSEIPATSMQLLSGAIAGTNSLRAALDNDAAAKLLGGFTQGVVRAESAAWRQDIGTGVARAGTVSRAAAALTGAVHLVDPATHNYSLSSTTAPIVVTIANDLPAQVRVRVSVEAVRISGGFSATPLPEQIVPANSRKQVSIPTKVNRIDKFRVAVTLTAPDGSQLGSPIELNVRSTALGGITKLMTVLAGTVLVIALVVRLVRRLRRGYDKELPHTVGAATR